MNIDLGQLSNIAEWESDTEYITALLSWSMGLLNIFHAPQLFFRAGFISYLMIYVPLMIMIGIPLTFMELGISQYSKTASAKSWNLCPLFRGVGYSKLTMAFIFQIYYNVLNSYVLFYILSSLSTTVKWAKCDIGWANSNCYNFQENVSMHEGKDQSSVEQFWYNNIGFSRNSEKLDWPKWELVFYQCATMFFVFLANCKGTKSIGKVLPFMMAVSSLEAIVLLFVTTITPGSLGGFSYLFRMNFTTNSVLPWKNGSMVLTAFQDILYSMGLGLGGFSSLGAQSSFRKPVHAYAILCNLVNVGCSIVFSVTLFNLYAILDHHRNIEIENQIIQPKTNFADTIFAIIPGALMYLPGPTQLWIFLFYSSIFLKGLGSSILMASVILQVVYESRPNSMKKSIILSFIWSLTVCLAGSILHTNLGILIRPFLNKIIYTTLLPLQNTMQVIAVLHLYGLMNFTDDLHFMLGFRPSAFWQLGLVGSSLLLPVFTVMSIIKFFEKKLHSGPDFINIFERCVLLIILFWIPFMVMVRVIRKGIKKNILEPSEDWGPHDNILRKSREMFIDQSLTEEYIYEKNLLKNKLSKYENNYNYN